MKQREKVFGIDDRKQVTLYGYHWHNAILDWHLRIVEHGVLHFSIELLRFKIEYHDYGPDPF